MKQAAEVVRMPIKRSEPACPDRPGMLERVPRCPGCRALLSECHFAAAFWGALVLAVMNDRQTSPAGIAVGSISIAVVAGWFAFVGYSFYGVFRHGLTRRNGRRAARSANLTAVRLIPSFRARESAATAPARPGRGIERGHRFPRRARTCRSATCRSGSTSISTNVGVTTVLQQAAALRRRTDGSPRACRARLLARRRC